MLHLKFLKSFLLVIIGFGFFVTQNVWAADGDPISMAKPAISPDGKNVAFLKDINGTLSLVVLDLNNGTQSAMSAPSGFDIYWHAWASNEKLLLSFANLPEGVKPSDDLSDVSPEVTRLASVDKNLQSMVNLFKLSPREIRAGLTRGMAEGRIKIQGDVIDILANDPGHILVNVDTSERRQNQSHVRMVDISNGDFTKVRSMQSNVRHWQTDQSGNVRLGTGVTGIIAAVDSTGPLSDRTVNLALEIDNDAERNNQHVSYYNPETNEKINISNQSWVNEGGKVLAFSQDPHMAYILTKNNSIILQDLVNDRKVNTVAQSGVRGLIYSHSMPPNTGALLGYKDASGDHYFDANYAGLQQTVNGIFQGNMVHIVSAAEGVGKFIIYAETENGGSYFLLDMARGGIDKLSDRY